MSITRKVKGVGWDVSAIGNGVFYLSRTRNEFVNLIFHLYVLVLEKCIYKIIPKSMNVFLYVM